MASLGIRHGGIEYSVIQKHTSGSGFTHLRHLTIPNLAAKLPNNKISTAVNATAPCDSVHRSDYSLINSGFNLGTKQINDRNNNNNNRTSIESPRVSETLDEWMHKSVTEIVKNIKQAPLLVQIYADGEVKTKKASPENDWKSTASLEGVILVEELRQASDPAISGEDLEKEDGIRAFGVLIQGRIKGKEQCKSTCYLLKTSSVCGGGLGLICTHFCLMKVQSFHQSVFSQFNDCWLV